MQECIDFWSTIEVALAHAQELRYETANLPVLERLSSVGVSVTMCPTQGSLLFDAYCRAASLLSKEAVDSWTLHDILRILIGDLPTPRQGNPGATIEANNHSVQFIVEGVLFKRLRNHATALEHLG